MYTRIFITTHPLGKECSIASRQRKIFTERSKIKIIFKALFGQLLLKLFFYFRVISTITLQLSQTNPLLYLLEPPIHKRILAGQLSGWSFACLATNLT